MLYSRAAIEKSQGRIFDFGISPPYELRNLHFTRTASCFPFDNFQFREI